MHVLLHHIPHRVSGRGEECGAVARALHHEAKFASPAVIENVSITTSERIQMSMKTNFKRIAFAVVVTLSLGMLGTAPTSAGTIVGELLTVDGSATSATSSITQGETATVSVVNTFTPESTLDSLTVYTSCAAPAGASCFNLLDFYWSSTTDSTSVAVGGTLDGSGTSFVQNTDDSFVITSTTAASAVRFTSNLKFRASTSTTAGTYTVTIYTKSSNAGATAAVTATNKSVTWTITVAAQSTTVASLNTYIAPTAAQAQYWQDIFATSKDSAVVASAGKNAQTGVVTPAAAAYIFANAKNAAGDTTTAANTNICSAGCTITATVTNGPGTLGSSSLTAATSVKSTTFTTDNTAGTNASSETLTVYSDGTPGVTTITFYNSAGAQVGTASVTFTGAPASATSVSLSDTSVAVGGTTKVRAVIKDSALSAIKTGTVYVFASDTKVVSSGAGSTTAAQYTQAAAGVRGHATACTDGYSTTLGYWECSLTIGDTGTATITLRDSWTVAASTWTSSELTVTGLGTSAASVAVAFDKASYAAGEQATITITVKDLAGRAATAATFSSVTSSMSLGTAIAGTAGTPAANSTTFTGFTNAGTETGIETRVVFMPATSGTVKFSIKYTPTSATPNQDEVTVSASAVVTNPAETAASAAKDAADAATDAAAEAIDAANAATDAANLAAEAADAATVAAEEARDAADAATAAVEELATQVATLMAALKAQITTLANTVAKIAKKVKA